MAARSTGVFPREGFNLDSAFQVTASAAPAPINMRNCRTLRLVCIKPVVTGDAVLTFLIGGKGYGYDAAAIAANVDANGVLTLHLRGYSMSDNNVSYIALPNTGTVTVGGVYVELLDGPAR